MNKPTSKNSYRNERIPHEYKIDEFGTNQSFSRKTSQPRSYGASAELLVFAHVLEKTRGRPSSWMQD